MHAIIRVVQVHMLDRWLWERKYLDLWSVVHTFTGACFGFATFFYKTDFLESFIVFTLFAILWEVIEFYNDAREPLTNQFMDVMTGCFGFWATNAYIPLLAPTLSIQIAYFTLAYIIAWTFAYYGFQSFALHFNREMEKYKKSFSGAILLYIIIMLIFWCIQ